eukprot:4761558-Lingulodinium_polyedra.AAC.1
MLSSVVHRRGDAATIEDPLQIQREGCLFCEEVLQANRGHGFPRIGCRPVTREEVLKSDL